MKSLSIILVSIFLTTFAYGQPATNRGSGIPSDAKVLGKVVDASSNQPVEYASIAIYRERDSSLVTGVVTDMEGNFTMDNLPYGKFYADITFIGYKKMHINNISLNPGQKIAALGTIKLDPSSTSLKEVVVVGNGNQMEYKIDKKVVNISQNIVASGGTVVDALQNTPSVQTDVEGNLTLRGSSSFTVLIDGKPSLVQGSEALQQIPAGMVQNVEIITNPSAKYDAEGSAGIINVIMKKQKIKGFNGSVSLSAGTNRKYNENINLNYKYDKWNFTLGLDYRDFAFEMKNYSERKYYSESESALFKDQTINGSGEFNRKGKGIRGGIEYSINDKSSLSVSGRYGDRAFNRPMTALYKEYFPQSSNYIYYKSISSGDSKDNFYDLNLDYTLNLNNKGHQLYASVNYSASDENDPSITEQDTTEETWTQKYYEYIQRVEEKGDEKEYRFKTDYTYPISDKTRLEAGLQSEFDNDNISHRLFQNGVENLNQLDQLDFNDNINSGYLTFSTSTKILDFQLALRAENENRKVKQINMNKDTSVIRTDWFPTIHLSRKLPWDLQLQASYTRRITRPREWALSPLKRYMDPQNIMVGNPGLLPEFTDSYELNLQKKINETSFASIEGFYKKTNNPMQRITNVIDGISYNTTSNLGKDERIGVEGMLNLGITKWWTLNGSGSVYHYKLSGDMENVDSKSSTNWDLRANSMFRFKTGTSLQLNYFYNAPTVTAQGSSGAFYSTGIALRQELLKRKASLTLNYRDFIGSPSMENKTETINFYSFNRSKRETNVLTVTFTYRINNYKSQQNKRNSEEMNNDSGGGFEGGEMM
jgi:outer membrane receptor protein involved in Fe transport